MTIKDIATECGVSVSTVSRVLNGRPDVSESVRSRVLSVVKAQGFVPNNSARDLVKPQSDAIGVVVRGVGNLFFSDLLNTISAETDRCGYTVVVRFIREDDDEITAGAMLEREKKLRGLIFLGGDFDYTPQRLAAVGVPYVCCSYYNCFGSLSEEEYSSVSIDDHETAYRAVEYLISKGHRNIAALMPGKDDRSISELRYKGYCAAMGDAGLEPLTEVTGGYEMEDAYRGIMHLIDSGRKFTAVFTPSDTMALAAVKALCNAGRKVPEDCSLIAVDGLAMSEFMTPTLTTMVQPSEEMGVECVRILVSMIEGGPCRHIRLSARLRTGGSVASVSNT